VDQLGLVHEAILLVDSEVVVDPEEGPEALLDGGRGLDLVVQVLLACLNKQNPKIYKATINHLLRLNGVLLR
jgi:hypothetical protein